MPVTKPYAEQCECEGCELVRHLRRLDPKANWDGVVYRAADAFYHVPLALDAKRMTVAVVADVLYRCISELMDVLETDGPNQEILQTRYDKLSRIAEWWEWQTDPTVHDRRQEPIMLGER